jgi:hypothetical protein
MSVFDQVSQVIVLAIAVLLGVGLFIPPRRRQVP